MWSKIDTSGGRGSVKTVPVSSFRPAAWPQHHGSRSQRGTQEAGGVCGRTEHPGGARDHPAAGLRHGWRGDPSLLLPREALHCWELSHVPGGDREVPQGEGD